MPWNEADRRKYDVIRARYSSDMSDAEFAIIADTDEAGHAFQYEAGHPLNEPAPWEEREKG